MKHLVLALVFTASPALADSPTVKPAPINFAAEIKDARDKAFPNCPSVAKPDCGENWTLGYAAYLGLNTPSPHPAGTLPSPQDMRDAALGYRIYGAKGPIDLTTDERAALKTAMFRGLPPAIYYASCRLIVPEEECAK